MIRIHSLLLPITILRLVLFSEISLAQSPARREYIDSGGGYTKRMHTPGSRKYKPKQTIPFKHIQIDEETSFLFDTEESIYDYCLCSWKRGSRHGKNPPNFFERLTRFGSIFIIIFVKLTF